MLCDKSIDLQKTVKKQIETISHGKEHEDYVVRQCAYVHGGQGEINQWYTIRITTLNHSMLSFKLITISLLVQTLIINYNKYPNKIWTRGNSIREALIATPKKIQDISQQYP